MTIAVVDSMIIYCGHDLHTDGTLSIDHDLLIMYLRCRPVSNRSFNRHARRQMQSVVSLVEDFLKQANPVVSDCAVQNVH